MTDYGHYVADTMADHYTCGTERVKIIKSTPEAIMRSRAWQAEQKAQGLKAMSVWVPADKTEEVKAFVRKLKAEHAKNPVDPPWM